MTPRPRPVRGPCGRRAHRRLRRPIDPQGDRERYPPRSRSIFRLEVRAWVAAAALFAAWALLPGCALPTGRDAVPRDVRRAPYRLAISQVAMPVPSSGIPEDSPRRDENRLAFAYPADEFRDRVIRTLTEGQATTAIVAVGELDLLEARSCHADLLLRLRVTRAAPQHVGMSGLHSVTAGVLWLGTWMGGLLVPDSRYDPGLEVVCTAVNPHDGQPLARFALTSTPVNLRFLDRNPLASVALAQSLILPPFWTSDDPFRTSHTLSAIGTEHIVHQLVQVLGRLQTPQESQPLRVEFQQPVNGERTGEVTRLRARVEALGPIEGLTLRVNGVASPTTGFDPGRDRLPGFDLEQVLRLQPGRNEIQIEARQGDDVCSRTLVVFCDERASLEDIDPEDPPSAPTSESMNGLGDERGNS